MAQSICQFMYVVFLLGFASPCCALVTFSIDTEGVAEFNLTRSRLAHVSIEYSVTGGLFNQHMMHEQTMMLAVALRAQRLWWVPSRDRNTFGVAYKQMSWHYIESRDIYDMDSIKSFATGAYMLHIARMSITSSTVSVVVASKVCVILE